MSRVDGMDAKLKVGDEIVVRQADRYVHSTGRIIGLVPGGYEILMDGNKRLAYENDETIELRYPDE